MKPDKNMDKPGLFSLQEAPSTEPEAAPDKSVDKEIEELVCALTDPLIVWPGPWMDTIPRVEARKARAREAKPAAPAKVLEVQCPTLF